MKSRKRIPDPSKLENPGKRELAKILRDIQKNHTDWNFEKAAKLIEEIRKEKSDLMEESQKQMMWRAYRIMEMVGVRDQYGKQAWRDLKAKMNEKGWTKNYQRFNFYTFKALAEVTNTPWPDIDPPEKPEDRDLQKSLLDIDTIKSAIRRRDILREERPHGEREVFCLALSTIYGVRQVEIRRMKPGHIDRENDLLRIYTAKGNPRKWHLIPEPVQDVIENFSIEAHLPRTRQGFYHIFHRIFDPVSEEVRNSTDYNRPGPGPYGFHSVRRRLLTKLGMLKDEGGERQFEKQEIIRFMRWTEPSESMYGTYFNPPEEWKKEDQLALDRKILEDHPFIEAWRD